MAKLLLLILALVFGAFVLLWWGRSSEDTGWSAYPPAVASEAVPGTAPYPLPPADAVVIHAVVNNGPVSPDAQTGYEITILADGTVHVEMTEGGGSSSEGTGSLGESGVQDLLATLDGAGCFEIGTGTSSAAPDGGPTSLLTITLADRVYQIDGAGLSSIDMTKLTLCQAIVAGTTGVESDR